MVLDIQFGASIDAAIIAAKCLSAETGEPTTFEFNEVELVANAGDDPAAIEAVYQAEITRRWDAAQRS